MRKVLFLVIFSYYFISCASLKAPTEEEADNLTPFSLGMVQNFNLTPEMIKNIQFFSGSDTITLEKSEKVSSGRVATDGTVLLTGGEPTKKVLIYPSTPGTVAPKGVILGANKKLVELRISFAQNENNYLTYYASDDDFGSFILKQNQVNTISSGEGSSLMIKVFYTEQQNQSKVEPGRIVLNKNKNF